MIPYLRKAGFLVVAVIKSKYHSKVNVEQEMRVELSSLILRLEKLFSAQQVHTYPVSNWLFMKEVSYSPFTCIIFLNSY